MRGFLMSEVTLETMLKIDFVLHRIAKREYPVVLSSRRRARQSGS